MNNVRKLLRILFTFGFISFLLVTNLGVRSASANDCTGAGCVSPALPQLGDEIDLRDLSNGEDASAPLNLPALKAVVVVGPIDGSTGKWTAQEIANANLAVDEFEKNGVAVEKFYTPDTDWAEIIAAAEGAHFFIYRGHGISWGGDPALVGGFHLDERNISNDEIEEQLHLAPNAIVMIYACFAAGTSSGDGSPGISVEEAQRRVSQYSHPFFANGAGAYYADWYGYAFKNFVRDLFNGLTLGEAYKNYDFFPENFIEAMHPDFPNQSLWVDSYLNKAIDEVQWRHAFVGQPERDIEDLFASIMEVSLDKVEHVAGQDDDQQGFTISISNSPSFPFTWSANLVDGGNWVQIATTTGSNADGLTIVLDPNLVEPGIYTATLRVTSNTPGLFNADQSLPVSLNVVEAPVSPVEQLTFLPFVISR